MKKSPVIHYRISFALRTACKRKGVLFPAVTESKHKVTCQKCKDAISNYDSLNGATGDYIIQDNMIGTAKIIEKERSSK